MSKNGEEGYVLFKYNNKEQKQALEKLLDKGLELVKKMNELDDKDKNRKNHKETKWSEMGADKYDEKGVDRTGHGLPHPKSEKGTPK